MKNKIALLFILLTPIFIVALSSIYFTMGYAPEGTKNEGVFFNEYVDVSDMAIYDGNTKIEFQDGKWVLGVYITEAKKAENSLYLMRQLNVALNRDIFRIKRAAFFSGTYEDDITQEVKKEYPRIEIYKDSNNALFDVLQINSALDFQLNNPIFVIDPYGRIVMYFDPNLDPKKILKDLKVLI